MEHRCPGAVNLGRAYLDGYAFKWRTVADIELTNDDQYVVGILWEITDEHLASLDRFEGYPRKYFRQRVHIKSTGETVTGWAYMMTNQGPESAPKDEYRTALFEGYAQNDLSDEQLTEGLKRL